MPGKGRTTFRRLFVAVALAVLLIPEAVIAAETRPLLFAMGRFRSWWAGRPRSYDQDCWDHMVNIGATMNGAELLWVALEPEQGTYDYDAVDYADFEVNEMLARGIEPKFFLGLTPRWAALVDVVDPGTGEYQPHRTPPAEEYVQEFQDYVSFVANHFAGRVRYYSFWNEPNGCSWINNNCNNSDSYPLYTQWLIRCSEALKAADPNARLMAGNLDYNDGVPGHQYIQGMYDNGAGPHIDGISIHPYDDDGTLYWNALLDTRAVMVANGDADKPIWLTEYGWNDTDYQATADKLVEVLTELKKPQWRFIEMASYLVINGVGPIADYGLMDDDLNPRAGYWAFQNFDKTFSDSSSQVLLNPSFENGGPLVDWWIIVQPDQGPDIPPLGNDNLYGPQTTFGDHFGGKVSNWGKFDFHLGQIIEVAGYHPGISRVKWSLFAHVNMHSRHDAQNHPQNVHQVWEIGYNDDGSQPADINACDNYDTIADIDGSYTGNDSVNFYPLSANNVIDAVTGLQYIVLRVHVYNDYARQWSINNLDNVGFEVTARLPGDFDHDADVDLADFGHFQACLSGDGVPQTAPACLDARLDNDTDVDQDDYTIFKGCMTGPGMPADPDCAPLP